LYRKVGAVREHEEAVGKSGRNPQLPMIVPAQFGAGPAAERRRGLSQIDRGIKCTSGHHADELPLGLLDLVVQAAQNPALRARVIVLDEPDVEADSIAKPSGVPALQQEATLVSEYLRLEDQDVGN
jgi:hypothetical protein